MALIQISGPDRSGPLLVREGKRLCSAALFGIAMVVSRMSCGIGPVAGATPSEGFSAFMPRTLGVIGRASACRGNVVDDVLRRVCDWKACQR
jgi:hypothetical protein